MSAGGGSRALEAGAGTWTTARADRAASRRGARSVKRALDVAGASIALLVTAPALLLCAVLVRLEDGGPALYRQRRVGLDGREFDLLKLRSMRPNLVPVEELGQVRAGHPLVTRVGRLMRRLKIDELPQLINVLRGEMSLVGPRPTIPQQVQRYDEFARRRLRAPPGMTGWAQVSGNTALDWSDRIALDVWYVDHWSLALDCRTLVRTAAVVLLGERIVPNALSQALQHAVDSRRRG